MAEHVDLTIRLDQRAINEMLLDVRTLSAEQAAQITRRRMQRNIVARDRVRTGRMRDSVTVSRPRTNGSVTNVSVSITGKAAQYAMYQERGTRGSQAAPGSVLAFVPKGANAVIFRPRTGPVKGAHFARDAYRALTLNDFIPK